MAIILTSCPPGKCRISVNVFCIRSNCLLPAVAAKNEISSNISIWLVGCKDARVFSKSNKSSRLNFLMVYGISARVCPKWLITSASVVFPVEGVPMMFTLTTSKDLDILKISRTAALILWMRTILALFQSSVRGTSTRFLPTA